MPPLTGMDRRLQAVEAGDDRGDVAQERGVVEAGVEPGKREARRDLGVGRQQLAELAPLVGCAQ